MVLNSELDRALTDLERLGKYEQIERELEKAERQHPAWPPNIFEQVAIMNEEAGEVTKAVLHYKREGGSLRDIKKELIQTAAMCMRMLQNLPSE